MFELLSALATAKSARWLSVMLRPGGFEGLPALKAVQSLYLTFPFPFLLAFLLCVSFTLHECEL